MPRSQISTLPAPYSPFGMIALEAAVLERMVLDLHREVVGLAIGGHALRQRPAHQHAVALEAEVVVQAARVVLLDDEARFARSVRCPARRPSARASSTDRASPGRDRGPRRGGRPRAPRAGRPSSRRASSTSSNSSWARPGEVSSRQVRGAATVGRNRPRSEYGTTVVLAPLFWLQSSSTLPPRSVFF